MARTQSLDPNTDEQASHIRPHAWLSPSSRGTTHLPDTLRNELGNPKKIPWIPDANLIVIYNPDITLEEFEMGLDIMKLDIRLRYEGKDETEIVGTLDALRQLLKTRQYDKLNSILEKLRSE